MHQRCLASFVKRRVPESTADTLIEWSWERGSKQEVKQAAEVRCRACHAKNAGLHPRNMDHASDPDEGSQEKVGPVQGDRVNWL